MRAAECRQEVVESFLVGQVDDGELQIHLAAIGVKDVIDARAEIEEVPGSYARGMGVIVIRSGGRIHFQSPFIPNCQKVKLNSSVSSSTSWLKVEPPLCPTFLS